MGIAPTFSARYCQFSAIKASMGIAPTLAIAG